MTDILSDPVNLCSNIANTIRSNFVGAGDVCVKIITLNATNGSKHEEWILAHRIVLEASSNYLRSLVQASTYGTGLFSTLPAIEINFGFLPNAAKAFKVILNFLYTGEINLDSLDALEVLQVAKICQINEAETRLSSIVAQNFLREQEEKSRFQGGTSIPLLPNLTQVDFKLLLALQFMKSQPSNAVNAFSSFNSVCNAIPRFQNIPKIIQSSGPLQNTSALNNFMSFAETSAKNDTESGETFTKLRTAATEVATRINNSTTDSLVPSNDKEGWCRNKKYIERVPNGFMCTVCRKIYGRYNSVSYHVTIYHRNPPIKCDEEGCQFTTREARYIHFHKYYRHHIALPDSIDLGSRKCPFCRHVSKSPAMLEKHISRHMPNCNRIGRSYRCPQCPIIMDSQNKLHEHVSAHQTNAFQCTECNYRGRTSKNLEQHKLFKHSHEMFKKMLPCSECNFKCSTESGLVHHTEQMHRNFNSDSGDEKIDVDLTEEENTNNKPFEHYPSSSVDDLEDDTEEQPICLVKQNK